MRLVSAQAMLLLVPAALIIEVELTAQKVSVALPEQKAQLALTTEGLGHFPITCVDRRKVDGRLTPHEAVHLVNMALNATRDVNCHFQEESLFWSMEHLPFSGGTYAIYWASGAIQDALSRFTNQYGLCRRLRDDADADELREVEEKSQKWLDERTAALKELEKKLADARTAFEADRIPLGILAWALGILQIVGWGLTLILLPRDVRALREMQAAKKPSPPPQP